uniref:SSD domain-containing protein n=1 Tax=Caenorhabditis tropicalis TaxID=1561998 RepID=A0A1I7T588_9PELO
MSWFDDKIHEIFYKVGVKVHQYRLYFLLLSFAILTFASFGFIWFEKQTTRDPQYVFSPANAPWRYERAVLTEHWPLDEEKFWPGKSYDLHGYVDVIASGIVHPDYGRPNILNIRYLDEVARINDYIVHNLTVPVDINGKHYDIAYTDLCMRYDWACFLNDHITMLMPKTRWGNFSGPFAEFASDIINTQVNITYPIGWRGTEPIYFGALVGAPNLVDEEGHFDFATAIRLTYNTREGKVDEYGIEWRRKLAKWLTDKENPVSELLEFGVNHNMTLPEGLQDVADTLAPKFVGTCAILFTFSFLVSVVLRRHSEGQVMIDWVRSKPLVAAAGLMTPVMATVTSFGLILWCGQLYNAIVNVSPFLILCIGIDDLFIMSAEWHRTNPKHSAEKRIGQTLSEAAVAISITSITDITTFAVGCYTTLPGVQMFCMYTCVQCFFCYVYQIIFLGPVLAYAAEMEQNDQHALLFRKAVDPEKTESKVKLWLLSGSVNRQNQEVHRRKSKKVTPVEDDVEKKSKLGEMVAKLEHTLEKHDEEPGHNSEETLVSKIFREIIGPFILQKSTQICAFLLYLVYISLAIGGCLNIKEGLDPKLLVRESFYLSKFYQIIDETFWREGLQMQVVVNNPPDLFEIESRKGFDEMMADFEGTQYTMNANATMIWLRAYEKHLETEVLELNIQKPNTTSEWYKRCRDWLIVAGGRRLWQMDMVWANTSFEETPRITAFRFQLGLRNYRTPTDHTHSCKLMRSIAEKYSKFNVTTFHEYYPFADQYLELTPSLFQNMFLDLGTILLVSMIMIPEWRCAVAIVLSIASINVGVLGFMFYWGVNLDSVSIITVIMCIGFAVDLSAHIAYAFSQSYGNSHTRAVAALETLGWPVFLGASSTVLGILLLTLVDSYIVQIFFKTVFLVINFSILHGLIFLPILLMKFVSGVRTRDGQPAENEKPKIQIELESSQDVA